MMRPRRLLLIATAILLLAAGVLLYLQPHSIGRLLVRVLSKPYETSDAPLVPSETDPTQTDPTQTDPSETEPRGKAEVSPSVATGTPRVRLALVAKGMQHVTDIQFPQSMTGYALVLEKEGAVRWLALGTGDHAVSFTIDVITESEQGLLGLAFHPAFAENGRFYVNYTLEARGDHVSRIEEWRLGAQGSRPTLADLKAGNAAPVKVLMEVGQPYQNHNAGQLAFGPDGYLYIGWGDGGLADDPHGHGQNPGTFLGSMLRVDVNRPGTGGKPYAIPPDNPFVGREGILPEVWAYGLRNPWRYSFEDGRLVIADVGQNIWEEISIAKAGDNLGWKLREGFACFDDDADNCSKEGLTAPVFVYGRETGSSITGGYVYRGAAIPALRGHYVAADFVSGRMLAVALPEDRKQRVKETINLGKWPVLISTFGRDPQGELYVGAFGRGEIYRLAPAATP